MAVRAIIDGIIEKLRGFVPSADGTKVDRDPAGRLVIQTGRAVVAASQLSGTVAALWHSSHSGVHSESGLTVAALTVESLQDVTLLVITVRSPVIAEHDRVRRWECSNTGGRPGMPLGCTRC